MADERVCYAGDLSTDQIGRRVRLTVLFPTGAVEVEDNLRAVRHGVGPATMVWFEHLRQGTQLVEEGYNVDPLSHVQVLP